MFNDIVLYKKDAGEVAIDARLLLIFICNT